MEKKKRVLPQTSTNVVPMQMDATFFFSKKPFNPWTVIITIRH